MADNPYLTGTDTAAPESAANPYLSGGGETAVATEENPYLTEEAPGKLAALGYAAKRGLLEAGAIPEVIESVGVQGLEQPTMRQRRRAFEQGMKDPQYQEKLARAQTPAAARKVERVLGPQGKLDMEMAGGQSLREATLQDTARLQEEIAQVPRSEAQQRLAQAQDQSAKWAAWRQDPVELTASIAAESLPPSIAGAFLGSALLGPGAGTAAGVGAASGLTTMSSEFLGNAVKLGYDITKPEELDRLLKSETDFNAALQPAVVKAGIVGGVDAGTAGAAGRFVAPALAQGLKRTLIGTGKEIALQAAGGAGGELAGQVVSGQPVDWFDVSMEALAEVASGPAEVLGNVREFRAAHAGPSRTGQAKPTSPTGPVIRPEDNELPPPAESSPSPRPSPPGEGGAAAASVLPPVEPGFVRMYHGGDDPRAGDARHVSPYLDYAAGYAKKSDAPVWYVDVPADAPYMKKSFEEFAGGPKAPFINTVAPGEVMKGAREVPRSNLPPPSSQGGGENVVPGANGEAVLAAEPQKTPLTLIERKYLLEDLEARRPVKAELVDRLGSPLSEGYAKQGDEWVWTEPVKAETAAASQAREAEAAMADVRKAKEAAAAQSQDPDWSVDEPPAAKPTERAEAGVPVEIIGERPPDIIDWLEGNFPEGVKTTSKEDYGGYLDEATGKARKILSATRGARADNVIEEMHAQGMYRRIENEDHLLEAITSAAAARKGWKETAGKGAVEAWLERAINATDLNRGATLEGVFGAPVWVTKAALNGVLRVVRAAYRAGKSLAEAVNAGMDWLRAQGLEGFNEGDAREFLERNLSTKPGDDDLNFREFADQVDQTEPAPTREATVNRLYERRTNESDASFAARILYYAGGPEAGIALFNDTANGIPGAVRMFLGQLIVKQLSEAGQHEAAARFLDDHFLPATTDIAQSLQALAAWLHLTPAGKVIWAKRKIERAAGEITGRLRTAVDAAGDALDQANREGIEQTVNAPDIQRNAREAIEAAVLANGDVHKAVVMDLAEPWASSSRILAMAREAVRAKVNELLNKGPTPAGLRPSQHLRVIMDDLAQRAATIAANFFQGIAVHKDGLAGLYVERLGLDQAHATRLARGMDTEFERQVKAAKAKLPQRISEVRKRAALETESGLDKAIRKAMTELRVDLGRIVREHFTVAETAGRSLAEKLAQESGLTGDAATRLAAAVERRFAELVKARKEREIEKLLKAVPARNRKAIVERLVALSNLGALSNEDVWNAVRQRLDLPRWMPDLAARLGDLAEQMQRIPVDQVEARQRASINFLNEIEKAKGVTALDLGLAFYITNILTGLTTHAKNVLSTTLNAAAAVAGEHLRAIAEGRLNDVPILWEGLARGVRGGLQGAADIVRTGQTVGSRLVKMEPGRALELARFGQRGGVPATGKITRAILENRVASFLNLWKYNYRLMGAEDMLLFKPIEEMKAALLAKRVSRSQGLSGAEATAQARAVLGYGVEAVQAAEARAATEGFTGSGGRRRVAEILNLDRPEELRQDSVDYALRTTFNNRPYGLMGAIAGVIDRAKGSENRKLRVAATLVTPFTSIIANVVNESLNYSPVGYWRAMSKRVLMGHDAAGLTPAQRTDLRAELLAKATLGTLLMGAIMLKAGGHLDDDDPEFALYGNGPVDPDDRKGWLAAGGLAHSVKIGGRYYSYATTPAAIPMAAIGNVMDRIRDARKYKNRGAQNAMSSMPMAFAIAVLGGAKVITEQSFLVGLMDLAQMASEKQPEHAGRTFWNTMTRTATSAVVPNAVRQVDRMFDPQIYDANSLRAVMVNAVPFARGQGGQPALNALGMPVVVPLSAQFLRAETGDPLVKLLDQRGLWPGMPDRNHVWPRTGRAMTDDEYYQYVAARGKLLTGWLERQRASGNLTRWNDRTAAKVVAELTEKAGEATRSRMGF